MLAKTFDGRRCFVRVYFWLLAVYWKFLEGPEYARAEIEEIKAKGTNICSFSQVTVGTIVILLLHIGVYAAVSWVLIFLPIRLFGGAFYMDLVQLLAVVGVFAGLVIIATVWFFIIRPKKHAAAGVTKYPRSKRHIRSEPVGPSFVDAVGMRYKSWKEKSCFPIKFVNLEGRK